MIDGYEKLQIVDTGGKPTGLVIDVNWNPADERTNECKVLRLKFPSGEEHFVKKDMFLSFLWLIGSGEEHRKMIPQTITRTRWYESVVSVKAEKDIRKGEAITFPIKLSLPSTEEHAIAELKKEKRSSIF